MRIIKKLFAPFVGGLIVFLVFAMLRYGNDYWLGDSLSITGYLMILFAGLLFVAHEGVFNIISFGFMKFVDLFRKKPQLTIKYQEYVLLQKEKTKSPLWPILVVGIIFLLVGIIVLYV